MAMPIETIAHGLWFNKYIEVITNLHGIVFRIVEEETEDLIEIERELTLNCHCFNIPLIYLHVLLFQGH